MSFNTAIFYDIENLLKGYSFSQEIAANLSLSEIVESIKATKRVGQIALQRAYANWSDPRLAFMRGEINELGIDPIQVFGFARDARKNAADIQLAIDAIDLAHCRPALEIFVVVSGDGAFTALAKKLHEYGKTVIGCAYRSSASRTFRAVCDEFVWIADPEGESEGPAAAIARVPGVTDPRNSRLTAKIKKAPWRSVDEALARVREVLSWYAADAACLGELRGEGLFLSVVREGLAATIDGFDPLRFGYPKLVEFLQFACRDTPLCVVRRSDGQPVLMLRSQTPPHLQPLPDLEARPLHSAEVYRSILASGAPILRLPEASVVTAVAEWLARAAPPATDLGSLIEGATAALEGSASSEAVKLALLALVACGLFERNPEGAPLAEQTLALLPRYCSSRQILGALAEAARQKLAAALGTVTPEVLGELIPVTTESSASL